MVRSLVVACVVVGSALIAVACGGTLQTAPQATATPQSSPWWYSSGMNACGMSALYRANGVAHGAGSCPGLSIPRTL